MFGFLLSSGIVGQLDGCGGCSFEAANVNASVVEVNYATLRAGWLGQQFIFAHREL
jgi:hypothetical protein